ncbi:MAG: ABC transporter permease [Chloroflexi bacterium]|nr:ABC transporter permease [Chloroflexota bacterium]
MNLRDITSLVWSNLNRMRGRVIMTALGVLIGTAAIVVLVSLASGIQANATESFSSIGALNQITVFSGAAFVDGGREAQEATLLTPRVLADIEDWDEVEAVTPRVSFFGQYTLKLNRLEGSTTLVGIDPRAADALDLEAIEGTNRLGRLSVVVGSAVAERFFDPRNPNFDPERELPDLFGQTLQMEMTRFSDETGEAESRTIRLRVIGVLEEVGGESDTTIFMSVSDMQELNTWATGNRPNPDRDGYTQAIVIVADAADTIEVENRVVDLGLFAFSATSILQQVNIFFVIIQAAFGGIGAISLIVAAIGIANTMIMSILERTREIGLMKAVGASNRDVLTVFISEAAAIGLIGGIGGIIAGIGVAEIIDFIGGQFIAAQATAQGGAADPVSLSVTPLWLPIFALIFSLFIGLLSGIYPALRAVQLNPVSALKYE